MAAGSVLESDVTEQIRVHDVDSHLLEPPDLWTSRVATRWGDAVPHVVSNPDTGAESWYFGDSRILGVSAMATAGWSDYPPSRPPTLAEADPGAWEPNARLAWMDAHGVYSQVLYPNLLGFYSGLFLGMEPELRLACVRAYNDFQTEFCAVDPNRLIPLACLPFWDIDASVAELQRCAVLGHRGVNFGWEYERLGLPPLRSDHWAPLLSSIEEMGLPVSFHIGFNSITEEESTRLQATSEMLDRAKATSLMVLGNQSCIAELIMGGICHRYPTLKFVSVESGVGYIPYLLETLDWQFVNTGGARQHPEMTLPSEYFRRQIYGTFWFERNVGRIVDLYPDNFMFETDYPHPTSLSPGPASYAASARDTIASNLGDLPEDLLIKVLNANAERVYGLS